MQDFLSSGHIKDCNIGFLTFKCKVSHQMVNSSTHMSCVHPECVEIVKQDIRKIICMNTVFKDMIANFIKDNVFHMNQPAMQKYFYMFNNMLLLQEQIKDFEFAVENFRTIKFLECTSNNTIHNNNNNNNIDPNIKQDSVTNDHNYVIFN